MSESEPSGRMTAGLTIEQTARAIGVTRDEYARMERGLLNPNDDQIQKLADLFSLDVTLLKSARSTDVGTPTMSSMSFQGIDVVLR